MPPVMGAAAFLMAELLMSYCQSGFGPPIAGPAFLSSRYFSSST